MMFKKVFTLFTLCLLSFNTFAEDGLVLQFTIEESNISPAPNDSYTNAILMPFNNEVSADFPNLYQVKFKSSALKDGHVSVLTTLKDLSDGKPYYVGAKDVDFKVGERKSFTLERAGKTYTVTIDSSFGKM